MEAREVKIKRSIDKMSTAQMEHAPHTFEESHENNLEYITSLREKIKDLEEEVEELEEQVDEVNEDSPTFQKEPREEAGRVSLDIAGLKLD